MARQEDFSSTNICLIKFLSSDVQKVNSEMHNHNVILRMSCTTFGDEAFADNGPSMLIKLPEMIKMALTSVAF